MALAEPKGQIHHELNAQWSARADRFELPVFDQPIARRALRPLHVAQYVVVEQVPERDGLRERRREDGKLPDALNLAAATGFLLNEGAKVSGLQLGCDPIPEACLEVSDVADVIPSGTG